MIESTITRERKMEVARTILTQLGGGRFKVMTGAKNFVATDKGLRFRLPSRKINLVEITLNGLDLYDVKFMKANWTAGTVKTVSEHTDIYFDGLIDLFEKETGLYTSL